MSLLEDALKPSQDSSQDLGKPTNVIDGSQIVP